ncbi:MAG: ABC transporter permease [Gemmatimonadaceae bacterium]|nr:ABC transporter permease [Gemmatimonadaceae bacterium]
MTETLSISVDALRANKMRSVLTMLGIIIGIAAVITMIALGNGAQNAIQERIARLGTTVLQINPQRVHQGGVGTATIAKLTTKDVDMIRERAPNVVAVNWQHDRDLQVTWKNKNTRLQITGTPTNFLEVRGFKLAQGRMFSEADDAARRKVAVLGSEVLTQLEIDDPFEVIDQQIRIGGRAFTVVGVLAEKGTGMGGDGDRQILVPFRTGRHELFGTDRINDIWTLVSHEDSIVMAMAEIQGALRRAHRLRPEQADDFQIRNQADLLETMGETTRTFTLLLAGVAAVSLLVGGIGIMNIMLVSVTERTREIGVRKALGATSGNILFQFLAEAVILCIVGGILGIAAGVGGAAQLSHSMGWKTAVDAQSILLSFAFASGIGIIFGVWPARRASTLDPIVALRYE